MPTFAYLPLPEHFGARVVAWLLFAFTVIGVVIGLPFYLQTTVSKETENARAQLTQALKINASASELRYHTRDGEAAVIALVNNFNPSLFQVRYSIAQQKALASINELRALLADSNDQLILLNNIENNLLQREPAFSGAIQLGQQGHYKDAIDIVDKTISRLPVSGVVLQILAAEAAAIDMRQQIADTAAARNNRIIFYIAGLQVLLVTILILFIDKQFRHRLIAEKNSQEERVRTERIFQSIREPIALLDAEQRVIMCNQAFSETYNLAKIPPNEGPLLNEISGDTWKDEELLQRLLEVQNNHRELWDYEITQKDVSNRRRTLLINARRISITDNDLPATLITVTDVSPLKGAELRSRNLNRDLENKVNQISEVNQELEAFSYTISHDLRAPLRHISSFSGKLEQQILRSNTPDEKSLHYLDTIKSSAARLSLLIDDLLAYSKLGRHALRTRLIDMEAMVNDVYDMLETDHRGRQIKFEVSPLPSLHCDESLMRQVWQNLLGNALKYTQGVYETHIQVGAVREGDFYTFSVKDNGAGFDPRYVDKLFGIFQRLHKPSEFSGSGIGLAITKRVIERHGGTVSAESIVNGGATFYFSLPVKIQIPEDSLS